MKLFDWVLACIVGSELAEEAATDIESEASLGYPTSETNTIFIDSNIDIYNSDVYIDYESLANGEIYESHNYY